MTELTSARILARTQTRLSPWVQIVRKEVEFGPGKEVEVYHCVAQPDYVAILAKTPSGLIPLIRQYRPAVEAYTWELPAGLLEEGESPEDACRRELKEETGLGAEEMTYLGCYYPDTGRLENRLHAFFVTTSEPDSGFAPEPGISVDFLSAQKLRDYILSGKFQHQLHLGLFTLATLKGFKWD
jgi:8-oxo-dGTP pyrophosphatase MutT (NUDIX family)